MQTLQLPIIETPRTVLTVLHPNYARLVLEYQLNNKEHLAPWEGQQDADFYTYKSSCARAELAQLEFSNSTALKLIAIDLKLKKMVGLCYFTNIRAGVHLNCHVGYSIAKEWEGQGLMKEIVQAGIQYVFDVVGLHRITASYMPRNGRSEGLLSKLGFEREGYAKAYLKVSGQWEDMIICSLINPKV
jgi:ribosomal-protein-alanine N-acetyltransferase